MVSGREVARPSSPSVRRWLPPNLYPGRASLDGQRAVHLECRHCGASRWGEAEDTSSIGAPCEVVVPVLCARVEQTGRFTGLRVSGLDAVKLEAVAGCTCQTQIVRFRLAAPSLRHDVIHLTALPCEPFRCTAVLTSKTSACAYKLDQAL